MLAAFPHRAEERIRRLKDRMEQPMGAFHQASGRLAGVPGPLRRRGPLQQGHKRRHDRWHTRPRSARRRLSCQDYSVVECIGKSLYRAIYAEEPVSSRPIYAQRDVMPTLSPGIFAAAQGGAVCILMAIKAMAVTPALCGSRRGS